MKIEIILDYEENNIPEILEHIANQLRAGQFDPHNKYDQNTLTFVNDKLAGSIKVTGCQVIKF